MKFFAAGDTHGTFDIGKVMRFFEGREDELSKDDFLIICGDCGGDKSGAFSRKDRQEGAGACGKVQHRQVTGAGLLYTALLHRN